jgi:hypothetical protein
MSNLTTKRGGRRQGAGRKSKSLLEHVETGSFRMNRHANLLKTDGSLLEAAANAPEDPWLRRLAETQLIVRDGNGVHPAGSRRMVEWFADRVRAMHAEDPSRAISKPIATQSDSRSGHTLWIEERVEDGWLVAEVRSVSEDSPPTIVIRIASSSYCPDCVRKALLGVLERYETSAR